MFGRSVSGFADWGVVGWLAGLSVDPLAGRPVDKLIGWSVGWSVVLSVDRSVTGSFGCSVGWIFGYLFVSLVRKQ